MGQAVNAVANVVKSVVGAAVGAVAPKPKAAVATPTPVPATPVKLGDAVPSAVTEAEVARKRVANSLLQGAGRGAATEDKLGG